MEYPNKLFDTNDSIDFGQMKDESFKWIYLLTPSYLVWLIEETHVCFSSLELFYAFGKPIMLDKNSLTEQQEKDFYNLVEHYGQNHLVGESKAYLITIEHYFKALERKIINRDNFIEKDFEFQIKTLEANYKKLQFFKSAYNSLNTNRDSELRSILEI